MADEKTLTVLVHKLYEARKAAHEARVARSEQAAKLGECEYIHPDERNQGVHCYQSKRTEWCDICKAKLPMWEDYHRKSNLAGAALRAVIRAGKTLTPATGGVV